MISLKAKIREKFGRKTKDLRKKGILPAVLYGSDLKPLSLEIKESEFEAVYKQAGESSLILLEVEEKNSPKKFEVLIHDVKVNPITDKIIHADFYHPSGKKEVEAEIPLVFEGISPAVKELLGTLVHEISHLKVKGLAKNLPREIKVDISNLKTFEDKVSIKDLRVSEGIKILKEAKEIVALVVPPEKEEIIEEKPVEEKPAEAVPEAAAGGGREAPRGRPTKGAPQPKKENV